MTSGWEVPVPEGVCGNWRVETFSVSEDDSSRTMFRPGQFVPKGTYKRLMRGGTVVMSNTPMEIRTNWEIVRRARGHVLINGLGLGMVVHQILKKPEVESLTVVEASEDVISLVSPTYISDPRFSVIHADAFAYIPPKEVRFQAVWHDIWDYICADNLPEMAKLHRKYGRRTEWQGSWAKEICLENRRRYG